MSRSLVNGFHILCNAVLVTRDIILTILQVLGWYDVDVILEVLGVWWHMMVLHPPIQNMHEPWELSAEGELPDLVAKVEMSDKLLVVTGLQAIKLEVASNTNVDGGGYLLDMELCVDLTTLTSLGHVCCIGLFFALPENVVLRLFWPPTAFECLPDVRAGATAIILIQVARKARAAAQVWCHVRSPNGVVMVACLVEFCRCLSDIRKTITCPHANRPFMLVQTLLVDLVYNMHHVGLLGVNQVEVEHSTRDLVELDAKGNIEILLVLVLVDKHLILRFQLHEVAQLRDKQEEDKQK